MTLRLPNTLRLALAVLTAFGVAVLALTLVNSGSNPRFERAIPPELAQQEELANKVSLADAYLQKVRETGDFTYYGRADALVTPVLRRDPRNVGALNAAGTLALARHDFTGALRLGERARSVAPGTVRPLGTIVDAQVELGRYDAAGRTLQQMIDEKPSLASYARASYYRELHGDLDGATSAMALAVTAGGQAPENVAYVQVLLGNLELERGRVDAARRAYLTALARQPNHAPAHAGLGRVAAARGDLPGAIDRYSRAVALVDSPEHLALLGEAKIAAGRLAAGRRDIGLAVAAEGDARAQGENTATELAILEANHGSPARAVRAGRRAWSLAPGVRAANALGWALTRSGRPVEGLAYMRRALSLGSRDPLFLFHAGVAAQGAGRPGEARRFLTASLDGQLAPLWKRQAKRALSALPRAG